MILHIKRTDAQLLSTQSAVDRNIDVGFDSFIKDHYAAAFHKNRAVNEGIFFKINPSGRTDNDLVDLSTG